MLSQEMQQVLQNYNEGLSLYKKRNFKDALVCFKKALAVKQGDGPSQLYIERCEHFIAVPPPADWDGVFTMTTK